MLHLSYHQVPAGRAIVNPNFLRAFYIHYGSLSPGFNVTLPEDKCMFFLHIANMVRLHYMACPLSCVCLGQYYLLQHCCLYCRDCMGSTCTAGLCVAVVQHLILVPDADADHRHVPHP